MNDVRVYFNDLLGVAFCRGGLTAQTGFDCVGIAREAMTRAGIELQRGDLPATDDDMLAALDELEVDPDMAPWEQLETDIAAATQLCDVLVSEPESGRTHISVVVDAPRGIVLSAAERYGVYAQPKRRVRNLRGVYRWRGR